MKQIVITVGIVLAIALAAIGSVPHPATVVYRKAFLNQTGDIPSTVIFTPHKDNDFRISAYITTPLCKDSDHGGSATVLYTWNDGFNPNTAALASVYCTGGSPGIPGQASTMIRCKAGTPISIFAGDAEGDTYDLFISLERL